MAVTVPNLDDRDFRQLMEEARLCIRRACPQWTDLSPGDPGMALLEVFAHLTEVMIYRLNRLPEKAFIEFLRLMGVRLVPPSAAKVTLRFTRNRSGDVPIEIPRGIRVSSARTGGASGILSFMTTRSVVMGPLDNTLDVVAYHCDQVEGEFAGLGTGMGGQSVRAVHTPMIAPTGDEPDLMVGVEADSKTLTGRVRAVEFQGKAYRIWREVYNFVDLEEDRFVYVADRYTGTVFFAPAARMSASEGLLTEAPDTLAEVPPSGCEIRLWYRHGGGAEGNVAAGLLSVLRDPAPGLGVINPSPATGGRDGESLENALIRGPQEARSMSRAVTARDYEISAFKASGAVARAKAFTKAALWAHAAPGTVEVLLVPNVPEEARVGKKLSLDVISEYQTDTERMRIQDHIDRKRPLGTTCLVNWVRYKVVRIKARVVVHRGESPETVKSRVLDRLHATVNPIPSDLSAGWRFGYPLRASHIYDLLLSDPGVSYADRVRILVDDVPDKDIVSVASDGFQQGAWYAAAGTVLFRSLDDGNGWEAAGGFPDENLLNVKVNKSRPGMLAVVSALPSTSKTARSGVHISWDCGETWRRAAQTGFGVNDMDWMIREGKPILIMATDVGLYELAMDPEAVPIQILVDPSNPDMGFTAVTTSIDPQGRISVAVAGRAKTGVFLSVQGGRRGSFQGIGLEGEDIRVLEVQEIGPLRYLWAGLAVPGRAEGKGCHRWELRGAQEQLPGKTFNEGWQGGSCWALAFQGNLLFAGTDQSGVLKIDTSLRDPQWQVPRAGCGLPLRDVGKYHAIRSLAADRESRFLMTGSPDGVHRSEDQGLSYESYSRREFMETVTLPRTWLFCSGEHDIEVVSENEQD